MASIKDYTATDHSVAKLNELLQGEMSAVETYSQAIKSIKNCSYEGELNAARACHQNRATKVVSKIRELGGEPVETSGLWGAFAQAVEGSATAFGEKAAITILEEGESHGIKQYQDLMNSSDPVLKNFAQDLYLKQESTHKSMSDIKDRLA